MSIPPLDPARTRRALSLTVEPLPDGAYQVEGGAEPHIVERDLNGWICDCADQRFNRGVCKHRLAVHISQRLDPRVVDALRSVVDA